MVHPISEMSFQLFRINRSSQEKTGSKQVLTIGSIIQSEDVSVEFQGEKDSSLKFKIRNKKDGSENDFEVRLRYWPSYFANWKNFYHGFQNSGAYIFRPALGYDQAQKYSQFINGTVSGNHMHFNFGLPDLQQRVLVHASIDPTLHLLKLQVDLDTLPNVSFDSGYEFVLEFVAPDINNNGTFYTDSNGLEMQKRKYKSTGLYGSLEISKNYYPVTSCIKIQDDDKTLLVMVGRTQGATSMQNGIIQIMANRRTGSDDARGLGEPLNVTEPISSTYFIQLSNFNDPSSQRQAQQLLDNPPQTFFAAQGSQTNLPSSILAHSLITLPDSLRLVTFPLDRNKLLLRIENLHDTKSFDLFLNPVI